MFLVERKVIVLWPGTLDLINLDFHETKTGRWSLSDSDRVPDFKTLALALVNITGADLGGAEGAAAPPFSSSEIYFLSKYTIIL